MHTVVETLPYLASATKAGMTDAERLLAVDLISANPGAGEVIVGGGGIRKIRVPGRGKGKSGGYRVLTYFSRKVVRSISCGYSTSRWPQT